MVMNSAEDSSVRRSKGASAASPSLDVDCVEIFSRQ
jgi:hypothetical protein